jgi:RimJ/RimL family protein N-acetyltransferase
VPIGTLIQNTLTNAEIAAVVTVDLVVDDGRTVCVRHLQPADRGMYRDAVAGLSPRSRYLRFAAPIPMISESLLNQMMECDGERHVAYAALTVGEYTIVGVARFIRTADNPHAAEVAIAVADDWQGDGLGLALLARVVERATQTDLRCLTATTLRENPGAARLAPFRILSHKDSRDLCRI